MTGVLLCCLVHQVHRGASRLGCCSVDRGIRHLKGHSGWGSYSAVRGVRRLMGQPLYCSAAKAGMWGERAMVMAPRATCDSAASPCSHGCPAFLHRHFPPRSPPSHPLDPSLCSQEQPSPWDCSTIPKLQLPAAASSGVCMAVSRTV